MLYFNFKIQVMLPYSVNYSNYLLQFSNLVEHLLPPHFYGIIYLSSTFPPKLIKVTTVC